MNVDFLICSCCSRHVKRGTTECPFCGGSAAPRAHVPKNASARIALVAAASAAALGMAGCSSEALYGAPCTTGDSGVSSCGPVGSPDAGDAGHDASDAGGDADAGAADAARD